MPKVRNMVLALAAAALLSFAMTGHAQAPKPAVANAAYAKATFAGGCFWCMEHPFDRSEERRVGKECRL